MRNYLIIGGSSGIGSALVDLLTNEGHHVIATHNEHPIDSGNTFKYNVLIDDFDLGKIPPKLDGLVYCPGSINLLPFKRIKPESFLEDYELQVIGAVKVIQAVLPNLKASELSSVVMFSTVAVQTGYNFHSQVAASKGAVEGMIRALAAEYAPSIRFNAVAPSLTQTPLAGKLLNSDQKVEANAHRHPLKRMGQAEDIAEMASFLLSDKSSWITGQILHVDGGISAIGA